MHWNMLLKIRSTLFSAGMLIGKMLYRNDKSKILYYHDVHEDGDTPFSDISTPMSLFKKHIEIIRKNGFEIVPEITKERKQVMICFDDGYRGIYKQKLFFDENKVKPLVFLVASFVGMDDFVNKSQIQELQDIGFRFQSHTYSHNPLPFMDAKELESDLTRAKLELENVLNHPVDELCFPLGYFSNLVIDIAHTCGYKKLYSSIPGYYGESNDLNVIHRNLVQFATPNNFEYILFGSLNIFRQRYKMQHFHAKKL